MLGRWCGRARRGGWRLDAARAWPRAGAGGTARARLLLAVCSVCAVWPAAGFAGPPAAFVQADKSTGRIPWAVMRVTRGGRVVGADTPLQACDKVEFTGRGGGVSELRVVTLQGGAVSVLNERERAMTIACRPVTLSDGAVALFTVLFPSFEAVAPVGRQAGTRGDTLDLPVLDAPQTELAAGRRRLFLNWRGGLAPYRVLLEDASGRKVFGEEGLAVSELTTPPIDLEPGRYRLTVWSRTPGGGERGLTDDSLVVVPPEALPRRPQVLESGAVGADERELLYAYYLEGCQDGRWNLEAMQHVAAIRGRLPAADQWLKKFGGTP